MGLATGTGTLGGPGEHPELGPGVWICTEGRAPGPPVSTGPGRGHSISSEPSDAHRASRPSPGSSRSPVGVLEAHVGAQGGRRAELDALHTRLSRGSGGRGAEEKHPRVSRAALGGRGLDTQAVAGRPGGRLSGQPVGNREGHQPWGSAPTCREPESPRSRSPLCSSRSAGLTPSLRPPTTHPLGTPAASPARPPHLPHARPACLPQAGAAAPPESRGNEKIKRHR